MGTTVRIESGLNLMQVAPRGSQARCSPGSSLGAALLAGLLLPCLLVQPAEATPAQPSAPRTLAAQDGAARAPQRYVLAGASGAKIMNLADAKGREVLRVKGDTPLAVYPYREGSPYLKVAAPGGVKIWVYGQYLTESARPGWVEVSGSYVNMRPLPRSQDSYPLGQLDRGARLRFIQRLDPSKPMAKDWVQVYSPPETMAFVLAAETRALPAGAKPKTLWAAAVQDALHDQRGAAVVASATLGGNGAKTPDGGATAPAAKGAAAVTSPSVFASLASADRAMDQALASVASPDYESLLGNYRAVLALGPDAPTRRLVETRMERLEAHRELSAIRAEIANSRQVRDQELAELREAADRGRLSHDPLWGRFQTRGWLERQTKDGESMYLVRWGADFLAQVQCSSGRYPLDLYDGLEIGVKGISMRPAGGAAGDYPLIDIDRIEVISARRPVH